MNTKTSISCRLGLISGASALAIVMASAFGASALAAQSGSKSDKEGIPEITVTAQFREENLQTTPLSITAITGAMLDARSQTSITDITAQAPNVQLQQNAAGGGNSMRAFIRGVGQSDQDPAVDPGVGVYVDDVYFASITGSIFDLMDLDRVEILRGPQGTLSGMNSMGGSVKLFSKKPTGDNAGFLEGTAGSLRRTDVRGAADFTIVPDELFFRIAGVSRHHKGFVTQYDYACLHPSDPDVISGAIPRGNTGQDCKLGTLGGQSMSALRGQLRWVATDKLEINISADGTDDNSSSTAATLLNAAEFIPGLSASYSGIPYDNRYTAWGPNAGDTVLHDPYVTYANFSDPAVTYTPIDTAGTPGASNGPYSVPNVNELHAWGIAGNVDWQLNDKMSLKSITGYRSYTSKSAYDNDGSPAPILLGLDTIRHKQFSEELRLSGTLLDSKVDYTVGGIYFRQKTFYELRVHAPFIPVGSPAYIFTQPIFDFIQNDPTVNKWYAGFAHAVWHVTDKLDLTGGIRYTEQDKSYTFYRYNIDGTSPFLPLSDPANPLNGLKARFKGSHVDYRADLSYQWTDNIMTYVQFSTGFKGGGISPRPYYPQQAIPFGPESLRAYEAGLKSRLFEDHLQVNTSVFHNNYRNYQGTPTNCVDVNGNLLPAPYNTPCGEYQNIANAKVDGVEVEAELYPVEGLMIDASFSWLDFRFGDPFIQTGSIVKGQSAPGIGDIKWSLGIQYDIPFVAQGTLTPRFDIHHTPGYCGNLNCDPLVSNTSYELANFRLTYRPMNDDWSVALQITNLFDKLYYINKFTSIYTDGQPGMPREWAITVRKNF